jgi:ubiquinone/menaquinone biosynthesis C-methylase UbiE
MKEQVTIVDIGGGQGLLVAELVRHLPQAQGVVQDRAEVLASSPAEVMRFADRLELRGGDFFNGVPEVGDVYLLSRILHDWPDEQAEAILRSCRRSMPEGARLCVLEQAVPEADALTDDERIALSIKDLNMLVLVGGKERTLEAYRNLLEATGFSLSAVHHGEACDVLVAAPV